MPAINLTQQQRADDAYDCAQEEAAAAVDFDELLEDLLNLTPAEKAEELRKAQRGEESLLLSDAWDRSIKRRTGELLREAAAVAYRTQARVEA
jgi:hypothetical protein